MVGDFRGSAEGAAVLITAVVGAVTSMFAAIQSFGARRHARRARDATRRTEIEVRDQGARITETEAQLAQAFKDLSEGQAQGREVGSSLLKWFRDHE